MKLRHLQSAACVAMTLVSLMPPALAQQQAAQPQQQQPTTAAQGQVSATQPAAPQAVQNDTTGTPGLPQAPAPLMTKPFDLRPTSTDYSEGHRFWPNPKYLWTPRNYPEPRLSNTPALDDLLKDGKIFLSLDDAVTLALENNYDIAIARINLDIADTDILRAKAGASLRGVSTGLVTNTLGGTTSTITGGGGPGGTTSAAGGSGAGSSGLVLSTNGGGPASSIFDPYLAGTLEYEWQKTQGTSIISPSQTSSTLTGNATYNQGFSTGTTLSVGWDNTRSAYSLQNQSSASAQYASSYNPSYNSSLTANVTQHLLQGCCVWLNRRFIIQAKNDRQIADSAFRQQLIYTIGQVESIYWALVSAYEDEQAKERALQQSTQLASDNRKQLQIGTLAPLDVVNSDAAVATDKQSLITSQSNLEYQQLLMKQAIARNLNDPQLANAPVVPTDRVGLDRLPEEDMGTEALVREAYTNNPQVEQATISMENNKITIRAEKNGLLPVVDAIGYYGSSASGGNYNAGSSTTGTTLPGGYGGTLGNTLAQKNPDYGIGVNVNIPLRNRAAQADQVRSQMEYRQTEMRLQQLYTQIRIQVINGVYALTNDRAGVTSAQSSRDYAAQALDAEQKKYRLGASTTANVLQQERNLATAENSLISAQAAYARDRSALYQILANTLDRYDINITEAATGTVVTKPAIPGLTAPQPPAPPKPLTANPGPVPGMDTTTGATGATGATGNSTQPQP